MTAYIADLVPSAERATTFGRVLICPFVALSVASPLGAVYTAAYKESALRSVFWMAALLSVAPVAFALLFLAEPAATKCDTNCDTNCDTSDQDRSAQESIDGLGGLESRASPLVDRSGRFLGDGSGAAVDEHRGGQGTLQSRLVECEACVGDCYSAHRHRKEAEVQVLTCTPPQEAGVGDCYSAHRHKGEAGAQVLTCTPPQACIELVASAACACTCECAHLCVCLHVHQFVLVCVCAQRLALAHPHALALTLCVSVCAHTCICFRTSGGVGTKTQPVDAGARGSGGDKLPDEFREHSHHVTAGVVHRKPLRRMYRAVHHPAVSPPNHLVYPQFAPVPPRGYSRPGQRRHHDGRPAHTRRLYSMLLVGAKPQRRLPVLSPRGSGDGDAQLPHGSLHCGGAERARGLGVWG